MKRSAVKWLDRRIAAPGPFLALCLDEAEFEATCKQLKVDPKPFVKNSWSHATAHHFDGPQGLSVVICIRDWQGRDPVEVAGLLIHEAVHAWQGYAEHIGERDPGIEQEAYAIQSIAQELLSEFARRMR
jgi:hypothetical protein